MFELDKWQEIGNSLWQHKLRTLLTSVGISWGIFMLIFLLGAGKGLENGTMENFAAMNKNSMWVWGQKTSIPYKGLPPGRNINIVTKDYLALKSKVKGIDLISPRVRMKASLVKYKDKSSTFLINGIGDQFKNIKSSEVIFGRNLNKNDIIEKRKVVYIGVTVSEKFFKKSNPVGKYLDINGAYFKIIGVFKSKSMGEVAKNQEERIYLPYTTLQQTFNKVDEIGVILLTLKDGFINDDVEKDVKAILGGLHTVSPDDDEAVGTWGSQEDFNIVTGLFFGIKSFTWMVGLGTILIGVISISNIMLITVKERTKEIGLRKALGASPMSVVGLILHEAIVLTSLSGFLGLVSGVFVVDRMAKIMTALGARNEYFANPEVDIYVAVAALIILIVSGTVAGLIPAIQAARIDPIEALRAE